MVEKNIALSTMAERAYLAGFVDGEGCFHIGKAKASNQSGYHPTLTVCNTNIKVLEYIQTIFGGTLQVLPYKNYPKWKPRGVLAWSSTNMRKVITMILPFLVIKKEHAEIVLGLQATKLNRNEAGRSKKLNYSTRLFRAEARKRLTELNYRGIKPLKEESEKVLAI